MVEETELIISILLSHGVHIVNVASVALFLL